jgi:membrane-bound serine protease (ClpP class)
MFPMRLRRLLVAGCFLVGLAGVSLAPAAAQEPVPPVEVVELEGLIDRRLAAFAVDEIEGSDAQLVVLQLDSAGAVDGDVEELISLIEDPPLPVAVWVGPDPAVARGAAVHLLAAAAVRGAAPGVEIGHAVPAVAGTAADPGAAVERFPDLPTDVLEGTLGVDGVVPGLVDVVSPTIGQLVVGLDGRELEAGGRTWTLSTARTEVEDGIEVVKPAAEVTFVKPGLVDRTLRLAVRPEVAFFFLIGGLAFAVFEFYAVGPGVAAGVALAALLLAGYGMAVLPLNWWAVGAAVLGVALYVADFQRNDLGWRSLAGTGLLVYGGLRFVDLEPQITVLWWPVILVVIGAAMFFGFAMTTVVRSRFSTATIGREHLVGRSGTAQSDLDPDGVVVVGDSRWKARAARAAGIASGDTVRVVGVEGITLDVEPGDVRE